MERDDVRRVRSFNRAVSQRIGALNDDFLARGRPLGASRLLYEIGLDGAELRALRSRLDLDSGYLSRLLRRLERQGLVEAQPGPGDGRARRAMPTARGKAEIAELDRLSDDFALSVLAPLKSAQRARLVAAMAEVERLLGASAVTVVLEPADSPDARFCLEAYFRELASRFEAGFDPTRSISASAAELTPPAGLFLVARSAGRPVGCVALKVHGDGIGEIKRMWVRDDTRGLGVGRRLLAAVEAAAGERGVRLLRLETNRALTEARALYRGAGFAEVAPFNTEPYAHHWFEKDLATPAGRPVAAGGPTSSSA